MGLARYRRKRDFERTPEPRASAGAAFPRDLFVVQKHAASSLHYDLRLRVGDGLKSWAVPKGPSLDPRAKRLAIEVEDHPVSYAEFEGVIPEGEYGGGTVMIWDRGRWRAEGDARRALAEGMLKFRLEGERLKGRWMLVRTARGARQPQWLLVKERDGAASAGVHAETFATSVATGRTMDEIGAGAPARERPAEAAAVRTAGELTGARTAPMPAKLRPMLAEPAGEAPEGDGWLHEVKFDGYRLLVYRRGESVRVMTRRGLDWTAIFAEIAAAVGDRLAVDAVLDGEAVLLDARGVSDFQALQNAIHGRRSRSIVLLAFDLPWCDGYDLTKSPLEQRVALLASLLGERQEGRVRLSQHVRGNGPAAFRRACEHGLEGLVCKKLGSSYAQARTRAWVKVKCFNQQEFVVGGFTPPDGTREAFGALLVGYYDEGGALRYAGRVGTGFSTETLRSVARRLRALERERSPFKGPLAASEARGVRWVRPELVAQVQFRDWTSDGLVRNSSFRGMRDDVAPESVTRQAVVPTVEAAGAPERARASAPKKDRKIPARGKPGAGRAAGAKGAGARATAAREPNESGARGAPVGMRLTSPERVVYPDRGAGYALTKGEVAAYYASVAERILPFIAERPLAVLRCPTGEGGKAFFQKHPAKGMPAAVASVDVEDDEGGSERMLMIRDADGLLALVQLNVLEFHPWGCRVAALESPDRLVFDLDPGRGVTWKQTVEGAVMVREALAQMSLRSFARTSGGKGIHVVVPLAAGHTWEQVKGFSAACAKALVRLAPRRFVSVAGASNREGRIFVDHLRNARGATAVASYSTRARPGAPVALPVSWDELAGVASGAAFTVPSVLRRLASGARDPWEGFAKAAGRLPE